MTLADAARTLHDPGCRRCPRLVRFLDEVRGANPRYFCAPVPPFGPPRPALLIVGLAPGLHGANRTGRPFTGDHAGILLYRTLHEFGFATRPASVSAQDELRLERARLTNAVKCLPPQNRPTPAEVRACNAYLAAELAALPAGAAVLALGRVAHEAVLRACGEAGAGRPFAHGAEHPLSDGRVLFDSYHCSRYNTSTRRLTPEMFRAVFRRIDGFLGRPAVAPGRRGERGRGPRKPVA